MPNGAYIWLNIYIKDKNLSLFFFLVYLGSGLFVRECIWPFPHIDEFCGEIEPLPRGAWHGLGHLGLSDMHEEVREGGLSSLAQAGPVKALVISGARLRWQLLSAIKSSYYPAGCCGQYAGAYT